MMRKLPLVLVSIAAVFIVVWAAKVVAEQWSWSNTQRWPNSRYGDSEADGQDAPGRFDYYALVLSWSPTYCADEGEERGDDQQCNRRDGRRYAFVLHGLWPQYERGFPSECRLPRRPFVPETTIDSMLDIMPSRGLVIHEYRTHGTCSGLQPTPYFNMARRLFEGIRIPDRFRNPYESQLLTPGEVERAFLRDNPSLREEAIALVCQGGGRLREVRICFSKDGRPRACGGNENQHKLCSATQVMVPPVRSKEFGGGKAVSPTSRYPSSDNSSESPLPGPRMNRRY